MRKDWRRVLAEATDWRRMSTAVQFHGAWHSASMKKVERLPEMMSTVLERAHSVDVLWHGRAYATIDMRFLLGPVHRIGQ
jgi:hypothetical protein